MCVPNPGRTDGTCRAQGTTRQDAATPDRVNFDTTTADRSPDVSVPDAALDAASDRQPDGQPDGSVDAGADGAVDRTNG